MLNTGAPAWAARLPVPYPSSLPSSLYFQELHCDLARDSRSAFADSPSATATNLQALELWKQEVCVYSETLECPLGASLALVNSEEWLFGVTGSHPVTPGYS